MFIVFGWDTTVEPLDSLLTTRCLHCAHDTKWSIWKETQWLSLFFIKVFPYINTYYISCEQCGDSCELSKEMSLRVLDVSQRDQVLHDELVGIIQKNQVRNQYNKTDQRAAPKRPRN